MSDRLIRYRILDAVPAESRIEQGFHRLGLFLGMPFVVLGLLLLPFTLGSGAPNACLWAVLVAAVGGFFITLCNTLGWIVSGFFSH